MLQRQSVSSTVGDRVYRKPRGWKSPPSPYFLHFLHFLDKKTDSSKSTSVARCFQIRYVRVEVAKKFERGHDATIPGCPVTPNHVITHSSVHFRLHVTKGTGRPSPTPLPPSFQTKPNPEKETERSVRFSFSFLFHRC